MPQNTVSSTICFSVKCFFMAPNAASSSRAVMLVTTSALNQSAYCLSHNVPLGKKLGLTDAQVAAE